ncbi:lipopolysaccharide biosynthesis protein [Pseudomonas sp. DNDY-54]|uniref:lipopolysaccharide biosynthesis protein n=1 Tax=Pseudomonas sp. DNDY-54 TaxID=2870860 RepID=UPI001CA3A110|nr:lipopolysaccharide biosynthesis protein [Pseudomonas sp. DNDY-54]
MNKSKVLGYAVGPVGSALLGFVSLPIITWFYSAEDVGRIAMLQVATSFCVLLFCLGLDQAYVREYHEEKDRPALLKNALLPGLLSLAISGFVVLFYDTELLSRIMYAEPSTTFSLLTIGCFAAALISRFLSLILRMQEKALAFSMSQLLPKLLFIIVISVGALMTIRASFYTLITVHAISIVTAMLVFAWNTRSDWVLAAGRPLNKARLHHLLQFGLPLVVGGIASWGLNFMDKLFLRFLSGFTELGIYSVTTSIAAGIGVFSGIFTTIWAPTVFKWAAEGISPEKIDEISEHVAAAAFFIFVITGLLSWTLPYFLPDIYEPVQYLITACIAAPLFYALSEAAAIGISIKRKTSYSMLASVVAVSSNLVGNYMLVPTYGAAGAAASTALSFWIFLLCRTELACVAWRRVPRFKLYSTTFLCLAIAVTVSLIQVEFRFFSAVVWFVAGCVGFSFYKRSIIVAKNELVALFQKSGLRFD